ncbi:MULTISPECIES: hypothetical protein [unclassified Corallococcus]|uniref:hypothetical protein n=1 Tax=unclassified Corallococcus TaxID=2685029 RepID=UPI001A901005|nr:MULTISPECIES: hypothetical protein [unclassified Corallococcus]MBN9687140.1 hypothetical protein [Corallococcus sp. NCSPR001]WAS89033.1 hypothetical protein O0N60_19120 [Corallococcus sp. NCRR]
MKKRLTLAACLAVVLAAPSALAAETTTSVGTSILIGLLSSPEVLGLLATGIVTGIVALVRAWKKDKAEDYLKTFARAVELAYFAVNDLKSRTATTLDNKAAVALEYFRDALAAKGYTSTLDAEREAVALWKSMHGQEKTAEKLASLGAGSVGASAALDAIRTAAVPSMPRGVK